MHILHLVPGRDVSPNAVHILGSHQEAVLHEVALHGRDIQPVLYLVVAVAEDLTGDVNIISWRQERDGQRGRKEERRKGDKTGSVSAPCHDTCTHCLTRSVHR